MNAGSVDPGTPWDAAFRVVDRTVFLPRRAWWRPGGGELVPIDRGADPSAWHSAVSADEPITTQLDDGATAWPATSGASTSSASQPSVVRAMLEALDVRDGHSVLEIGTGSGYNAALLAARLGSENVTTVEVDAELATGAREALRSGGFRPSVVCGDGARGVPGRAPYDRLISTASLGTNGFPPAWLDQVSTGGVILAPWGGDYHAGGLVRLTKAADGSASGPVVGGVSFMRLRAQRARFGHANRLSDLIDAAVDAREWDTPATTTEVATNGEAAFAAALRLRGVQKSIARTGPDEREILLYDPDSDSAATLRTTVDSTTKGNHPVRELGPRSLWTEAVDACRWWNQLGRPDRTRFGLTVRPDGNHVLRIDDDVVGLLRR